MWTFARQEESKIKDALVLRYGKFGFFSALHRLNFLDLSFVESVSISQPRAQLFKEFSAQDKINSNKTKASFQLS